MFRMFWSIPVPVPVPVPLPVVIPYPLPQGPANFGAHRVHVGPPDERVVAHLYHLLLGPEEETREMLERNQDPIIQEWHRTSTAHGQLVGESDDTMNSRLDTTMERIRTDRMEALRNMVRDMWQWKNEAGGLRNLYNV